MSPLSRNDLIALYCTEISLAIPTDSELYKFLQEEHWTEVETLSDCVFRLLMERMYQSRQGY